MTRNILDIKQVDFMDVRDVQGFATLIFRCADGLRMFQSPAALRSPNAQRLSAIARQWIEKLNRYISILPQGDVLKLLSSYDIMHRIAYHAPADVTFLTTQAQSAFEARRRGEGGVDEYTLFRNISQQLNCKHPTICREATAWKHNRLKAWWENFRTGHCCPAISDFDALQQIEILLREDLGLYEANQQRFKRRLVAGHLNLLQNRGTDIDTLEMQATLLTAAHPYLTPEVYRAYQQNLTAALQAHPATNRYHRAALTLPTRQ